MGHFDYLFSLFGLLLGFILVEVLSGLVRTLRAEYPAPGTAKVRVRVGWLTPLLGVFTLFDVAGWWGNTWVVHERIPLGYDTLFGGVMLCSIYYFAAAMVFPDEPRAWPDLDEWFWLRRRQVLGCILAANLVWMPIIVWAGYFATSVVIATTSVYIILVLTAMWTHRSWLVGAALGLLVLQNLAYVPIEILQRNVGR